MDNRGHRLSAVPDAERLAACRADPAAGPKVLFFSGGGALRDVSRLLPEYTHNSIHVITPFDSGGSSAHLRRAFGMPSVGDLRNRLIALAPADSSRELTIHRALAHRLPLQANPVALRQLLQEVVEGSDALTAGLPEDVEPILHDHLRYLIERLPDDFEPRGANVGNLVITACYLAADRDLDRAIQDMSELLNVRGKVCASSLEDADLAAALMDGSEVTGQHLLTGKEAPPLTSPIQRLWLVPADGRDRDARPVRVSPVARQLIASADLICFPVGSFHSSVLANLLPAGVGQAIADNPCPKIYVPNTGVDPEQHGLSVAECLSSLITTVQADAGGGVAVHDIVNMVLLDSSDTNYATPTERQQLAGMGVTVASTDLVTPRSTSVDARCLAEILVSNASAAAQGGA